MLFLWATRKGICMKISLILTIGALVSTANASEALRLVCSGKTVAGSKVEFMLSQDAPGVKSATLYARTQRSGIGVVPPYIPRWVAIEGCVSARLAGLKNGELVSRLDRDLYLECDADGDYGWMSLNKVSSGLYKGFIQSEDGIPALGLKGAEKVEVRCSL